MTIAVVLLGTSDARAGYRFVFTDASGTAQDNFNIDFLNQTFVDVSVYLVATGATDINTLRTAGLRSYGVEVGYTPVAAQVLAATDITSNAAFTAGGLGEFKVLTSTSAAINDQIDNVSPSVLAGPTQDRIFLATFRFTGINNGVQTISTSDPAPGLGLDDTVTGSNVALDALIANSSATITVTNVPEPGTMALTGLLAAGIGGAALRRFRRTPPAAA